MGSAFQVFMQGVLKYEGDKLPEFLSSNSERGLLNEDIQVSEKTPLKGIKLGLEAMLGKVCVKME